MANSINSIINEALGLNATERANVAEQLLKSLDKPDSSIDAIWAKEADLRIEKYTKGEIKTVSAKEVFAKYNKA